MKKATLLSSLLTMAVILSAGCTKSQINKDLDNKLAEINRQNEETLRKLESLNLHDPTLLTDGGQAGSISLNGVAVIDTDKLDARISVSQEAGLNLSGSATTTKKDLKLNSLETEKLETVKSSLKKLEDERSYINLGCELAESEIAGLTDVTAKTDLTKDIALLSASRIFICGEQKVSHQMFSISASEVMLKAVSITSQKNLSGVSISAGTLVLVGKNKIASFGENGSGYRISAASINLTVTNEIYGDGELALESKGGNNIAEEKKASN